jgi:hypothetical protein
MPNIKNIAKGFWNCLFKKNRELSQSRMRICKLCEFKEFNQCGICGCYLKAKTSVIDENCPEGKWQ